MLLPQAPNARLGAPTLDYRRVPAAVLAPGSPSTATACGAAAWRRPAGGAALPGGPFGVGLPTRGSPSVKARLFREAGDRETALSEAAAAAAAAATAAHGLGDRTTAAPASVPPPPSSPEGPASTAEFIPSTRQHHAMASAPSRNHPPRGRHEHEGGPARKRQDEGDEGEEVEDEVDELEARAVGVHPDILVEDLAEEATVPYDAAGGLDSPGASSASAGGSLIVSYDDAGNALGSPSLGAGPHEGLAIEDLDPRSGGFTTSRPAVDPAYDDVGRAIRAEAAHRQPRPSLWDAVATARKTATAEDIRETVLDEAPELQDVYEIYGPVSERGRSDMGGAEVGDDRLEELLERADVGVDGAVVTDGAEVMAEPDDPLSAPADAGPPGGSDPLAPLDALAHREALERLEGTALADIADVVPSPLPCGTLSAAAPRTPPSAPADLRTTGFGCLLTSAPAPGTGTGGSPSCPSPEAAPAAASASGRSSSRARSGSGGSGSRWILRLGLAGGGGGARARGGRRGPPPPHSRAPGNIMPATSSARAGASLAPPFYHTSPDVPDEDLERRPRPLPSAQRRRLRRRRPQSELPPAVSAALAATAGTSGTGPAAPTGWAGQAASAGHPHAVSARAGGYDVLKAPVYGNSPDVPDDELERCTDILPAPGHMATALGAHTAATAAAASAATPAAPPGGPAKSPPPPPPQRPLAPPQAQAGDSRRLKSLGDVDRQFIDLDTVSGWDEQAHDLRMAMRSTVPRSGRSGAPPSPQGPKASQPPGARGATGSLQTQTIGIHGGAPGGGAAAAFGGGGGGGGGGEGRPFTVLRVESVPSQTYGVARTAAVLAADGQLTLLARPTGPSPERVRAAIKLLRMAPGTRDFRDSAAAAEAAADANDERQAAATEAAVVAAVAAAAAAAGTPGMELEALERQAAAAAAAAEELGAPEGCPTDGISVCVTSSSTSTSMATIGSPGASYGSPAGSPSPSIDERDLMEFQPGLMLGVSEINPEDVPAEPGFPLSASWVDPHDPHGTGLMSDGEGHMLGMQANVWHEDYDEVMGQIVDAQRSGWSEDAINGSFDSDVY